MICCQYYELTLMYIHVFPFVGLENIIWNMSIDVTRVFIDLSFSHSVGSMLLQMCQHLLTNKVEIQQSPTPCASYFPY